MTSPQNSKFLIPILPLYLEVSWIKDPSSWDFIVNFNPLAPPPLPVIKKTPEKKTPTSPFICTRTHPHKYIHIQTTTLVQTTNVVTANVVRFRLLWSFENTKHTTMKQN